MSRKRTSSAVAIAKFSGAGSSLNTRYAPTGAPIACAARFNLNVEDCINYLLVLLVCAFHARGQVRQASCRYRLSLDGLASFKQDPIDRKGDARFNPAPTGTGNCTAKQAGHLESQQGDNKAPAGKLPGLRDVHQRRGGGQSADAVSKYETLERSCNNAVYCTQQ